MKNFLAVLILTACCLNSAKAATYVCGANHESKKILHELLGKNIAFRQDLEITLEFDSEINEFLTSKQGGLSIRNLRNNKVYSERNVTFIPFSGWPTQSLLTEAVEDSVTYHIGFGLMNGELISAGDYISIKELAQGDDQKGGGVALCKLNEKL